MKSATTAECIRIAGALLLAAIPAVACSGAHQDSALPLGGVYVPDTASSDAKYRVMEFRSDGTYQFTLAGCQTSCVESGQYTVDAASHLLTLKDAQGSRTMAFELPAAVHGIHAVRADQRCALAREPRGLLASFRPQHRAPGRPQRMLRHEWGQRQAGLLLEGLRHLGSTQDLARQGPRGPGDGS